MKRIVLRIGLALLLMVSGVYMYGAGEGETFMRSTTFATERPPIDRAIPTKLETATFALG